MPPHAVARWEHALFALLVRSYPESFRREYGGELHDTYASLRAAVEGDGAGARARLWRRLLIDTMRSAPREWWHERRTRRAAQLATLHTALPQPDYRAAWLAGGAVFMLYMITLAPTTAFWDAGEYITVAHVAGIAHPPGNPLFVMLARVWDVLLAPTGWPTAVRINVFSAVCSAVAHLFLYLCIDRALLSGGAGRLTRRIAAVCAVVLSATAFTVWHQSNVNEKVYTVSFATTMAVAWLALRWRDTRDLRLPVLALYIAALSATNHLMGVLVLPAVVAFAWHVDRRVLFNRRVWAAALPAMVLALSVQLLLPIRSAQQPLVNESEPSCESLTDAAVSIYSNGATGCPALSATLKREQYGKPSILRDPTNPGRPRSAGLITSQVINYLQYVDWQWARSVSGHAPLFGGVRPLITLIVLLLAAAGARAHWRSDRQAALLHGVLLATLSVGLVAYLNFKYGFVIARDRFPDSLMHEVRERDYFFLISFSLIGAWAGLGLASSWRSLADRLARRRSFLPSHARLAAAPLLLLAIVPLALNHDWASRADDWTARDWAYNVLMSVEPYGVLVTNGDNDSFPLWYLQHVERVREDVTIVLSPYLATDWYARQIRDATRPCPPGVDPAADPTRAICQRPFRSDGVHPRLLAAWGDAREVPLDSVLPLSDAEIASLAANWLVAEQPLVLEAGGMSGTVASGSLITPIDTFVAALIRSTYGERPIHFMAPSETVAKLGLEPHTVRVGLTWKLDHRRARDGIIELPMGLQAGAIGAAIDLPVTDTLARDVFVVRGRVTDPSLPWVDHATWSMPLQYATMNYAAAVAHELTGSSATAMDYMARVGFWERFVGD